MIGPGYRSNSAKEFPELEGVPRNSYQFRNHNLHELICEWSVVTIDRIPLRNSRNWKDQESIRNWTEFPELEGVPRNCHQFRNYNLHGLNYEWLGLAIDRIPLRNSRNCKDQESIRNWTEFPELEGVPRNSYQFRNYNLHGLNYEWLGLAIDRIPLRNFRNWKEFLGIPTNSGITTHMGLFANDRSWLSIEFR
jgi:hypothetical protein